MLVYSDMSRKPSHPDYDLADRIALTTSAQVKAISHPLRTAILGMLHERAATVTELAVAVERPKSTVAHHVKVLAAAGLDVVVLEMGPHVTEPELTHLEHDAYARLYLDGNLAPTADLGIGMQAGSCLGGGTVIRPCTAICVSASPSSNPGSASGATPLLLASAAMFTSTSIGTLRPCSRA